MALNGPRSLSLSKDNFRRLNCSCANSIFIYTVCIVLVYFIFLFTSWLKNFIAFILFAITVREFVSSLSKVLKLFHRFILFSWSLGKINRENTCAGSSNVRGILVKLRLIFFFPGSSLVFFFFYFLLVHKLYNYCYVAVPVLVLPQYSSTLLYVSCLFLV